MFGIGSATTKSVDEKLDIIIQKLNRLDQKVNQVASYILWRMSISLALFCFHGIVFTVAPILIAMTHASAGTAFYDVLFNEFLSFGGLLAIVAFVVIPLFTLYCLRGSISEAPLIANAK